MANALHANASKQMHYNLKAEPLQPQAPKSMNSHPVHSQCKAMPRFKIPHASPRLPSGSPGALPSGTDYSTIIDHTMHVFTWNVNGISDDAWDVLCDNLDCPWDVLLIQEATRLNYEDLRELDRGHILYIPAAPANVRPAAIVLNARWAKLKYQFCGYGRIAQLI